MNFLRSLVLPTLLVRNVTRSQTNAGATLSIFTQKMQYSSKTPGDPNSKKDKDSGIFKYMEPVDIDIDIDGTEDDDNIIETGVHRRENCDRIILRGLDDDGDDDDDFY